MADQVEITKLTQYVAEGPPADHVAITKLVMFVVLVPGEDGSGEAEAAARQGFVYGQRIRRG